MTDNKALDANVREGAEKYGDDPAKAFEYYTIRWMAQEIAERDHQQNHDALLYPKLRGIIAQTRWMQIGIVVVAATAPLVMLALLLWHVYRLLPAWLAASESEAVVIAALSTPVTALIVGTFASFIVVYSALVFGVFSQLKKADDTSRKQNMSIMPNIMADAVKKSVADD